MNRHRQQKALAPRIADGQMALKGLTDAVPVAHLQRVADDGAAAMGEHAHALDARAVRFSRREQALPGIRTLDLDEVLHAHELGAEAGIETVREHVGIHRDLLLDVGVEHRADALLQQHADDTEQDEEKNGEDEQYRLPAQNLSHKNFTPSVYQSSLISASSESDSPSPGASRRGMATCMRLPLSRISCTGWLNSALVAMVKS